MLRTKHTKHTNRFVFWCNLAQSSHTKNYFIISLLRQKRLCIMNVVYWSSHQMANSIVSFKINNQFRKETDFYRALMLTLSKLTHWMAFFFRRWMERSLFLRFSHIRWKWNEKWKLLLLKVVFFQLIGVTQKKTLDFNSISPPFPTNIIK